jgi:hypothetical protein
VYERASLSKSRFRMFSLRGDATAFRTFTPRARCGRATLLHSPPRQSIPIIWSKSLNLSQRRRLQQQLFSYGPCGDISCAPLFFYVRFWCSIEDGNLVRRKTLREFWHRQSTVCFNGLHNAQCALQSSTTHSVKKWTYPGH